MGFKGGRKLPTSAVERAQQDPPAISVNLMSESTNRDSELSHRLDRRRIDDQALRLGTIPQRYKTGNEKTTGYLPY